MAKKSNSKKQTAADILKRWPVCLACGQPRSEHSEEEANSGCRRVNVNG